MITSIAANPIHTTFPSNKPPPFNSYLHLERRETLFNLMESDSAAIIIGGAFRGRNGDIEHTFRQESNFYCLTGFQEPDSVAILEKIEEQCHFILIVPPKDHEKEIWNGKRSGLEGAISTYKADEAYDNKELAAVIHRVCQRTQLVSFIPATTNPATNKKIKRIIDSHEIPPLSLGIPFMRKRLVKTSHEIDLIRQAILITGKGFERVMTMRKVPVNEGLLQAEMEFEFRSRGAVRLAFPTIVASGPNATTLHYEDNDTDIELDKMVIIDCGAEYGHYASDITRAFPISGKFTQPQRELYQALLNAQKAAIAAVKPGLSINDLQKIAQIELTEGLRELGVLEEGSTEEDLDKYFPHPLGHHMGIDVHDGNSCFLKDIGLEKTERKSLPLQPGMVFTIEPGVYIQPNDETVPLEYRGIGIRIEDDILVTEEGCEELSKNIPKEPDDIEKVMLEK